MLQRPLKQQTRKDQAPPRASRRRPSTHATRSSPSTRRRFVRESTCMHIHHQHPAGCGTQRQARAPVGRHGKPEGTIGTAGGERTQICHPGLRAVV